MHQDHPGTRALGNAAAQRHRKHQAPSPALTPWPGASRAPRAPAPHRARCARRRMSRQRSGPLVALLASLLGHTLLLSALFGASGVGVPGLR